jgi:hypothetical protein
MFVGIGGALALQPPEIISTHTMATSGSQLVVKAPGVPLVYSASAGGLLGSVDTTTNATTTFPITGATHRELDAADSGLIYLTSGEGIDVVDSATNTLVAFYPAPAPRNYQSLAVDNATGRLFVSWTDGVVANGVVVLDATTGAELADVLAGSVLTQLAVNPATRTLYALQPGTSNNALSFDADTYAPKAASTVGNLLGALNPNGFAIDAANNRLIAIAASGGPAATPDSVSVFDGDTLALIQTYDLGAAQVAQLGYMPQSNIAVVTFGGPQDPVMLDLNTGATLPIDVLTGLNRGLDVDQENEFIYVTGTTNTTLTVLAVPAEITTPTVPNGQVGTAYSATIDAQGSLPLTLALTGGTLPPGLAFDPATGAITGTPTTAGTFTFTITATNAAGSFPQDYTVVINEAPVITTPPVTPPAVVAATPPELAESGSDVPWIPAAGVGLGLLLVGAVSLVARRIARS